MSDVHREHPEASEAEIERIQLGQLIRGKPIPEDQQLERICRNCGDDFLIPDRFALSTSKWTKLCPSCLMDEI